MFLILFSLVFLNFFYLMLLSLFYLMFLSLFTYNIVFNAKMDTLET